jgi:hypothetical protein
MMGLPFTIFLTLSFSLIFFFQKKPFTFLENSIFYMVMNILITNVITILSLNFNLINTTENPLLFPAFLLYREGIIPLLVLIVINIFHSNFTLKVKVFFFILIFACLNGIEALLVSLEVFQFLKWNFLYAAIVNIVYLFIGLWIVKIVLSLKGVQINDRRL